MIQFNAYDEEIRAAELRIALNRQQFDASIADCVHHMRETARNTVTSPLFLLGAAGVGFLLSRLFVRPSSPAPAAPQSTVKKSLFGVIVATAFSIAQAHFGGPLGLARWVMSKLSPEPSLSPEPATVFSATQNNL